MDSNLIQTITAYRKQKFCTTPELRIRDLEQALNFINQRGFLFFWPIKGIILPSLWAATVGERPVPNDHDDPGHVTWDWKDKLLASGKVYYARVIRKRNSFISLEYLPYFYALSPNFGDIETDHLIRYEEGSLSAEAKAIYDALLKEGPLDTLSLRKAARITNPGSEGRFSHALDELQNEMKVLPVGISDAGTWHYAFIYDLAPRRFSDLISNAGTISENLARQKILSKYLDAVGGVPQKDIFKLFKWPPEMTRKTILSLCASGSVLEYDSAPEKDTWIISSAIIK